MNQQVLLSLLDNFIYFLPLSNCYVFWKWIILELHPSICSIFYCDAFSNIHLVIRYRSRIFCIDIHFILSLSFDYMVKRRSFNRAACAKKICVKVKRSSQRVLRRQKFKTYCYVIFKKWTDYDWDEVGRHVWRCAN